MRNNLLNKISKVVFLSYIILYFIFLATPTAAQASDLSASPAIMDIKSQARDILKESLTIFNNTNNKLSVYTFVNNVSTTEGEQKFLDPAQADLSSSLANWISISRGVIELAPKEKRNINFSVEVNLRARPGIYHAAIAFVAGATRFEAEKKINEAAAAVINLEVVEVIKERLQIKKFIPTKIFFSDFPAWFSYTVENVGNQALIHSGEIVIYNRRGEEAASLPINQEGVALDPKAEISNVARWDGHRQGVGLGKYKAILRVEFGKGGFAQDTIFFWIVPWPKIALVFASLAALTATAAFVARTLRVSKKI